MWTDPQDNNNDNNDFICRGFTFGYPSHPSGPLDINLFKQYLHQHNEQKKY